MAALIMDKVRGSFSPEKNAFKISRNAVLVFSTCVNNVIDERNFWASKSPKMDAADFGFKRRSGSEISIRCFPKIGCARNSSASFISAMA